MKNIFLENFNLCGVSVAVRKDKYRHAFYADCGEEDFPLAESSLFTVEDNVEEVDGVLCEKISITANREIALRKLYLRTGVDTYMESYPVWNDLFFPTMLQCEPTHFKGYLQAPNGSILAICSPDIIKSWSLDYCRAIYGDVPEENHVGHRIYSFCLHLVNEEKEGGFKVLKAGENVECTLYFTIKKVLDEVEPFWKKMIGIPSIISKKWTYEQGETLEISSDGALTVTSPSGKIVKSGESLSEEGRYEVNAKMQGRMSTANLFVRPALHKYLRFAADCAFSHPQRPSTHAETFYGYFSAFGYALHSQDKEFLQKTLQDFDHFCKVMQTEDGEHLVEEADPPRVQNISTLISLYVLAYRASREGNYLQKAIVFARRLMEAQDKDGAYLGYGRVHYTCVIYPAKSMLELCDLLQELGGYEKEYAEIYASAHRAITDLSVRLDNIQTEGQQTFEDGMISCAALQLGMLALRDKENRALFTDCAKKLLRKHECLERRIVTDSRSRGCTLRFWESMYDVLIDCNMINSPHGWTSWKTYATFYLYLLTGELQYLTDTFDTLGASLQCFDLEKRQLNWAYIVDPVLKAGVFSKNGVENRVFGECYLPMISDWWQSDRDTVCRGYAFPKLGIVEGRRKGACCDNDVHEHIKCLLEVGLNAFIHEEDEKIYAYNCAVNAEEVILKCDYLQTLYYFSNKEKNVFVIDRKICLQRGLNIISLK